MSARTNHGGAIADINVTPLVDIVLVLLIIFMVVAEVMADDQRKKDAIPVDLPKAATAEQIAEPPLTIAVKPDGSYVLQGAVADRAAVVARVRDALAAEGSNLEVVVSADRQAAHERFVTLLDLLRAEGVSRFAIQTAPVDAEEAARRDG